jgi:hypothetical protein
MLQLCLLLRSEDHVYFGSFRCISTVERLLSYYYTITGCSHNSLPVLGRSDAWLSYLSQDLLDVPDHPHSNPGQLVLNPLHGPGLYLLLTSLFTIECNSFALCPPHSSTLFVERIVNKARNLPDTVRQLVSSVGNVRFLRAELV